MAKEKATINQEDESTFEVHGECGSTISIVYDRMLHILIFESSIDETGNRIEIDSRNDIVQFFKWVEDTKKDMESTSIKSKEK